VSRTDRWLKRRNLDELLSEELRRLDPDDVYAATARSMVRLAANKKSTRKSAKPAKKSAKKSAGQPTTKGA
jgi:hypothetical protein